MVDEEVDRTNEPITTRAYSPGRGVGMAGVAPYRVRYYGRWKYPRSLASLVGSDNNRRARQQVMIVIVPLRTVKQVEARLFPSLLSAILFRGSAVDRTA